MEKKRVIRVSPSQLKKWRRCQRAWAFRYINKRKEPTTSKQQFGTDCHTHMERWIGQGIPPPNTETGNVARQLIRGDYLPAPHSSLKEWVERKIIVPLPGIHPDLILFGYSDLVVPVLALFSKPEVIDYKFTSSLNWALTQEEAKKDPQCLIYSAYGMETFGVGTVETSFLYGVATNPKTGPRKPGGSRRVNVTHTKGDPGFEEPWEELQDDVVQIVHAKLTWKDANEDAEANPAACSDFGGCPHYEVCKQKPGERLAKLVVIGHQKQKTKEEKKEKTMDLMAKLKAHNDKKEGGESADVVTVEEPLQEKLEEVNETAGVNPAPEEPEGERSETDVLLALSNLGLKELKGGAKSYGIKGFSTLKKDQLIKAILPHEVSMGCMVGDGEFPKAEEPKAEEPKAEEPKGGFLANLKAKNSEPEAPAQPEAKAASVAEPSEPAAKDLAGYAKQKLDEVEAKRGNVPPTPQTGNESGGLMVLVDCVPLKGSTMGSVENLADWIKDVTDKVAKDNGVEHWGMIDYKAPATLALALENAFKEKAPNGCILVSTASAEGRATLDVLTRWAAYVFRGL